MILAIERPMPINEYVKDMIVAMTESGESLWKLGTWLRMI